MLALSMILFQMSETELRGSIMKEEVNSFIMECNSSPSSPIGDYVQIPLSSLRGGTRRICNIETRTEHATEGTAQQEKTEQKLITR